MATKSAECRPSRSTPFAARAEVKEYISHLEIECLECGASFSTLASHLRAKHEMRPDEYRARWAIPKSVALSGTALRANHRQTMIDLRRAGIVKDQVPADAAKAGRKAPRTPRVAWDAAETAERGIAIGRAMANPPSEQWSGNREKRAAYSLAYYHLKRGNPEPMAEFRRKHGTPERARRPENEPG